MFSAFLSLSMGILGSADPRIEPAAPTSCDRIRITVTRFFRSDCGWVALPVVETAGTEIRVALKLQGNEICLPVVCEKELPFEIGPFPAGEYVLSLSWAESDAAPFFEGPLSVAPGSCTPFIRGDANADGAVDLGDAVAILSFLFAGGPAPCEAATDTNGDGSHELGDAIGLLNHLFAGGPAPASPYPTCGLPAAGARGLSCEKSPCPAGPRELLWMALPDGCVQCEPCGAPPIEEVVAGLAEIGIAVAEWKYVYVPVCLACRVCASGRLYAVLVSSEDAERLKLAGWVPWDDRATATEIR